MTGDLKAQLAGIRLLAMDVDGVLTDGTLGYDSGGHEQKRFHVADGLGLALMRLAGIEVAWISGRASVSVERRAQELGVRHLVQGVRDKRTALRRLCADLSLSQAFLPQTLPSNPSNSDGDTRLDEGLPSDETSLKFVAYIGDDWNDLPALAIVDVAISVADGCREARAAAHIVTRRDGGRGAVREVCDMLLEARGQRESCLAAYLASLEHPQADQERGQTGQ